MPKTMKRRKEQGKPVLRPNAREMKRQEKKKTLTASLPAKKKQINTQKHNWSIVPEGKPPIKNATLGQVGQRRRSGFRRGRESMSPEA